MNKNIIIAGLIVMNLVLLIALAYVFTNWQPRADPPNPDSAAVPAPVAGTETATREFIFKAGEHLDTGTAPPIAGRTLTINATFQSQQQDGVIVAQGGLAHGYALYVQDGELFFAMRRNNALTTVSGGKIGDGRHRVTATLTKGGELGVALDGRPPATTKAAGPIALAPADGLDVGADRGASVGPYAPPNSFGGTIEAVSLKTTP